MRLSLGFILAISLAGLQFIAITIVVSTYYLSSERAMIDHAHGLLEESSVAVLDQTRRFLEPAQNAAELSARMIQNRVVPEYDPLKLETLLFQNLQTAEHIAGVFYGDAEGNFVYVMRSDGPGPFRTKIVRNTSSGRRTDLIWRGYDYRPLIRRSDPQDTYDPRTRQWYQSAAETEELSWTDPYVFFSSQRPGITVSVPIFDRDETVRGVVGVDIEIAEISSFLSKLSISEAGAAIILDDEGQIIAHPDLPQISVTNSDGSLRLVNVDDIKDPLAKAIFEQMNSSGSRPNFTYQGEEFLTLFRPITGIDLPWTVAIFASENDFVQGIKDNRWRNIKIAALISAITALIGLTIAELILRPVRAFAVRTALVSQGEVDAEAPLPETYKELSKANETLIREIAHRRESETKINALSRDLSQFSRIDLMGQMASGLAHELSQPMTAITQNIDAAITTAKMHPEQNKDLLEVLQDLDEQAHRGGDIIRALRGFMRKDDGLAEPFDMAELLGHTIRLMGHEINENAVEIRVLSPHMPWVTANRIQIAQVLVNLIHNAIEAFADSQTTDRIIEISAASAGGMLDIVVEDSGPGVPQDITLFKRFETSKPSGMGLGLSLSKTIVEANEGTLRYEPGSQGGARFVISLPIARIDTPES